VRIRPATSVRHRTESAQVTDGPGQTAGGIMPHRPVRRAPYPRHRGARHYPYHRPHGIRSGESGRGGLVSEPIARHYPAIRPEQRRVVRPDERGESGGEKA
jgi:hypothetical protein